MISNNFRFLLFPFSFLYGIVIHIRNFLFDKNILHSASFTTPTICIGNISVGGTGKTPMTEYIIRNLKDNYDIIVLSRGYKRKSKGLYIADKNSTMEDLGDEPMQLHQKFPEIKMIVCEKRAEAIHYIEKTTTVKTIILLDDAFQHRAVKASKNIVLTDYSIPYYKDYFLPMGTLRDQRSSVKRANTIIVSKCPATLSESEKNKITQYIQPTSSQNVYFSTIEYGKIYSAITKNNIKLQRSDQIIALTGIAKPTPFLTYLKTFTTQLHPIIYPDHYAFTEKDIQSLIDKYHSFKKNSNTFIITTEKDAVRLEKYIDKFQKSSVDFFVLPLENKILFNEANQLIMAITKNLNKNQ